MSATRQPGHGRGTDRGTSVKLLDVDLAILGGNGDVEQDLAVAPGAMVPEELDQRRQVHLGHRRQDGSRRLVRDRVIAAVAAVRTPAERVVEPVTELEPARMPERMTARLSVLMSVLPVRSDP